MDLYVVQASGRYGKLDLDESNLADTTFQLLALQDISKGLDDVTKNVSLKGTRNNNIILGSLFNSNKIVDPASSEKLYHNTGLNTSIECLIYEDDLLLGKGLLRIESVDIVKGLPVYNAAIFGYKSTFFNLLKDSTLGDLSFSELNHVYSLSNIKNAWSGNLPFTYPYIDYGHSIIPDVKNTDRWDYRNFKPAIKVSEYFRKIFSSKGYSYKIVGGFENLFNKLIIPSTSAGLTTNINYNHSATVDYNPSKFNRETLTLPDTLDENKRVHKYWLKFANTNFPHFTQSVTAYPAGGQSQTIFTAVKGINTPIETSITFQDDTVWGSNKDGQYVEYDVTLNLVTRESESDDWKTVKTVYKHIKKYIYVNATFEPLVLKDKLIVPAGGQWGFTLSLNNVDTAGTYGGMNGLLPTSGKNNCYAFITGGTVKLGDSTSQKNTMVDIALGDTLDFNKSIFPSEVKQVDLIKSICQMFNLLAYTDSSNPKQICFATYADYFEKFRPQNLIPTAVDWSNKIDFSSYTIKSVTDVFKNYSWTFKEDKDYLNSDYKNKYGDIYGSFKYINPKPDLTSDTKVEVIFSATPMAKYTETDKVYPLIFEYDSDNKKKPMVSNPRLLVFNGTKPCISYEVGSFSKVGYNYEFTKISTETTYPEVNTLYTNTVDAYKVDLNFGTPTEVYFETDVIEPTLYETYIQDMIKELNSDNISLVEYKAFLTSTDIANLDLSRPIFVDSPTGNFYYKIISVTYISKELKSTVLLQKVVH